MALEPRLEKLLHRLLMTVDEMGARGNRLLDDARRLWTRVQRFITLGMHQAEELDTEAIELACSALQLPLRHSRPPAPGRMLGQISLRERCEQAAELLLTHLSDPRDAALLERATRILRELPQRTPAAEESRLLADALNLDDFGVTGLFLQAMHLSRQHASVRQVADGYEKRRQYGYWEARLKDGFHFEPVREMARARLQHADRAAELLISELREDEP
jgi:hypothetical protein